MSNTRKVVVTTLTALALVPALSAPARAAQPGDLCQIGNAGGATVWFTSGGGVGWYGLNFGAYFRVEGYLPNNQYSGHGSGKPTGWTDRSNINQATCH